MMEAKKESRWKDWNYRELEQGSCENVDRRDPRRFQKPRGGGGGNEVRREGERRLGEGRLKLRIEGGG